MKFPTPLYAILMIYACLFFTQLRVNAQKQNIGKGYYNLTLPPKGFVPSSFYGPSPYPSIAQPSIPKVTTDFSKPKQTNDWWTSFIWNPTVSAVYNFDMHSWPTFAHPLAFQACRYGMKIKYPDQPTIFPYNGDTNGAYRYEMDNEDLTVGIENMDLGTTIPTKIKDYSDWTVTANWDDTQGNTLTSTIGHGFLYAYFTKKGGRIVIRLRGNSSVFYNAGNMIGINVSGHYYGLFAPAGSTWEINQKYTFDENVYTGGEPNFVSRTAYISDLNGKDYLSVALLPDNTTVTFNKFAQHAYAFIDSANVSWKYDEAQANLTTNYNFHTTVKEGTETQTMAALYRHQWLNMKEVNTPYTYISPRGLMKVNEGNTFSVDLKNFGIIPYMPRTKSCDSTTLTNYLNDEKLATAVYDTLHESYFKSIRICRQAQLAEIANTMGNTQAREKFLDDVQTELEDWFKADDGETTTGYLYYNQTWNTMIAFPAIYNSDINLNDHHFHYGYFIKSAAILAHFRPEWAKDINFGGMVKKLIKDVANWDRNDKMFPFLRNFDPYAGHSWAGGSSSAWGGTHAWGADQEASGESMNFASAVFQWGLSTKDTTLRDLGLFLFLNEKQAIDQYWFNKDHQVFPGGFNHVSGTRLWSNGVDKIAYGDEWSIRPEYIAGINILPTYATSLYLGSDPAYVKANYQEVVDRHNGPPSMWLDVFWIYQSLYDPDLAYTNYKNTVTDPPYKTNLPQIPTGYGDGISPSFLYQWLTTTKVLGLVNMSVTANTSSYAVFTKEGKNSYIVNNPGPAKEVKFSDGAKFNVPSDTLIAYNLSFDTKVNPDIQTKENILSVYPNPGKGKFTTSTMPADGKMILYNSLGSTVWTKKVKTNQHIEFDQSTPGIYYLQVITQADRFLLKIIVTN